MTKLKQFVEKRKRSLPMKDQHLVCKDCGTVLHKSGDKHVKLCMCYGNNFNKKIELKKTEDGYKLVFPSSFDKDDFEQFLKLLTSKK
jgi:hypothetical protein